MFVYTVSDIIQLAIVAVILAGLAVLCVVGFALKVWNRLKGGKP